MASCMRSGARSIRPIAGPKAEEFTARLEVDEAPGVVADPVYDAEGDVARENARGLRQLIDLQVWSSYYALSTATQRVRTTRDFLSAAQQSVDVASGRYRNGVGSVKDLPAGVEALLSCETLGHEAPGLVLRLAVVH